MPTGPFPAQVLLIADPRLSRLNANSAVSEQLVHLSRVLTSIALARLFLRRPKLLVLDEPTSQLDGEALQLIRDGLRRLMDGCTCFLVTHNAETIRLADRVLFLENGRLVGDSTHQVLYSQDARYRALWQAGSQGDGLQAARGAVLASDGSP